MDGLLVLGLLVFYTAGFAVTFGVAYGYYTDSGKSDGAAFELATDAAALSFLGLVVVCCMSLTRFARITWRWI